MSLPIFIGLTLSFQVENGTEWKSEEYRDKKVVTPIVLLSMTLFMYNIGLGSVPYVLISELFALNVSTNPTASFFKLLTKSQFDHQIESFRLDLIPFFSYKKKRFIIIK